MYSNFIVGATGYLHKIGCSRRCSWCGWPFRGWRSIAQSRWTKFDWNYTRTSCRLSSTHWSSCWFGSCQTRCHLSWFGYAAPTTKPNHTKRYARIGLIFSSPVFKYSNWFRFLLNIFFVDKMKKTKKYRKIVAKCAISLEQLCLFID